MEYSTQLERSFSELGFSNYDQFFKSAELASTLLIMENVSQNAVSMYDQNSDPDNIYYFFIVDKQSRDDNWYIHSVYAGYQMETERNQEGVLVVGEMFHRPIPNKSEIREVILEKIKEKQTLEDAFRLLKQEPHRRTGIRKDWFS